MIHCVVALAVILEILCEEIQVQPLFAGAELCVGVHDLHNGCRRFREIAAVGDAVVQINGAQSAKDSKTDAVIPLCQEGGFKRGKSSRVVAFRHLPGVGIVGDFRFSPTTLFHTPAAESALRQNLGWNFVIVVHA